MSDPSDGSDETPESLLRTRTLALPPADFDEEQEGLALVTVLDDEIVVELFADEETLALRRVEVIDFAPIGDDPVRVTRSATVGFSATAEGTPPMVLSWQVPDRPRCTVILGQVYAGMVGVAESLGDDFEHGALWYLLPSVEGYGTWHEATDPAERERRRALEAAGIRAATDYLVDLAHTVQTDPAVVENLWSETVFVDLATAAAGYRTDTIASDLWHRYGAAAPAVLYLWAGAGLDDTRIAEVFPGHDLEDEITVLMGSGAACSMSEFVRWTTGAEPALRGLDRGVVADYYLHQARLQMSLTPTTVRALVEMGVIVPGWMEVFRQRLTPAEWPHLDIQQADPQARAAADLDHNRRQAHLEARLLDVVGEWLTQMPLRVAVMAVADGIPFDEAATGWASGMMTEAGMATLWALTGSGPSDSGQIRASSVEWYRALAQREHRAVGTLLPAG